MFDHLNRVRGWVLVGCAVLLGIAAVPSRAADPIVKGGFLKDAEADTPIEQGVRAGGRFSFDLNRTLQPNERIIVRLENAVSKNEKVTWKQEPPVRATFQEIKDGAGAGGTKVIVSIPGLKNGDRRIQATTEGGSAISLPQDAIKVLPPRATVTEVIQPIRVGEPFLVQARNFFAPDADIKFSIDGLEAETVSGSVDTAGNSFRAQFTEGAGPNAGSWPFLLLISGEKAATVKDTKGQEPRVSVERRISPGAVAVMAAVPLILLGRKT